MQTGCRWSGLGGVELQRLSPPEKEGGPCFSSFLAPRGLWVGLPGIRLALWLRHVGESPVMLCPLQTPASSAPVSEPQARRTHVDSLLCSWFVLAHGVGSAGVLTVCQNCFLGSEAGKGPHARFAHFPGSSDGQSVHHGLSQGWV